MFSNDEFDTGVRDQTLFAGGSLYAEQVDGGFENAGAGNLFLGQRRGGGLTGFGGGADDGINNMMEYDVNNR